MLSIVCGTGACSGWQPRRDSPGSECHVRSPALVLLAGPVKAYLMVGASASATLSAWKQILPNQGSATARQPACPRARRGAECNQRSLLPPSAARRPTCRAGSEHRRRCCKQIAGNPQSESSARRTGAVTLRLLAYRYIGAPIGQNAMRRGFGELRNPEAFHTFANVRRGCVFPVVAHVRYFLFCLPGFWYGGSK